jgi:hypothetical protein
MEACRSQQKKRRVLYKYAEPQDNLCFFCDMPVILPEIRKYYENYELNGELEASFEHVVPKSFGGKRRGINVVIAHRKCNTERGTTNYSERLLKKLEELNIRRAYLFAVDKDSGKISPSTFGMVTPSSIMLVEELNGLDFDIKIRRKITTFMNKYCEHMKQLDNIQEHKTWVRVVELLYDDQIQILQKYHLELETLIRCVMYGIKRNWYNRRLRILKNVIS